MSTPAPQLTLNKVNEVLRRIAIKRGRDLFGLNEDEFRIMYFPWKRHAYRTRRLGSAVGIYFGVYPWEKEFIYSLDHALDATKKALNGKPQIELLSNIKKNTLNDPNWKSLPKLPPNDELVIEQTFKIVVRHRKTGIVAIRETPKMSLIGKMILEGKIEIAEGLNIMGEEPPLP